MKKVLLIYPNMGFSKTMVKLPLSLLYVAAPLVAKGKDVTLLDQRVTPKFYDKLKEELSKGVLCVGISTMSGTQLKYAIDVTNFIKTNFPEVLAVWGGVHPTLFPKETLSLTNADILVYGEGEATFAELVDALENNNDIEEVKGLYLRRNGEIVFTGNRNPIDLNSLDDIPYHLVDIERHMPTFIKGERSLMYIPDRGCPHACTFCSPSFKTVRLANPEVVIKNILKLLEFGVTTVDIGSENFFVGTERVREISSLLLERKIKVKLKAQCRLDYIDRWDSEFLTQLKESGFDSLQIGVESGSDRILKLIKKGTTVEQILRVNKKLYDAKITPLYSFFIAAPYETQEEVIDTIDLALKLVEDNPNAITTNFTLYQPFPGTELYDTAIEHYGYKPQDNINAWINLWDVNYPWASKEYQGFLNTISLVSYFFDEKSVANVLDAKGILRSIIKLYSKSVVYRCKKRMLWCFPETRVLRELEIRFS